MEIKLNLKFYQFLSNYFILIIFYRQQVIQELSIQKIQRHYFCALNVQLYCSRWYCSLKQWLFCHLSNAVHIQVLNSTEGIKFSLPCPLTCWQVLLLNSGQRYRHLRRYWIGVTPSPLSTTTFLAFFCYFFFFHENCSSFFLSFFLLKRLFFSGGTLCIEDFG